MTQMTLKRLMELSGVPMDSSKVTTLLEADQQVTELVKQIEDDINEYVHEGDQRELGWEPPSWKSGTEIWNEVSTQSPSTIDAAERLAELIGVDKAHRLIMDIANSVFAETQKDTSPEPHLG